MSIKDKRVYKVEVTQPNIKLNAFISLCKSTCKYKNVEFTFNKDKFIYGNSITIRYYDGKTNKKREHLHHVVVERPYTYINYKFTRKGEKVIECYSFEFNDDSNTLGTGYFLKEKLK